VTGPQAWHCPGPLPPAPERIPYALGESLEDALLRYHDEIATSARTPGSTPYGDGRSDTRFTLGNLPTLRPGASEAGEGALWDPALAFHERWDLGKVWGPGRKPLLH